MRQEINRIAFDLAMRLDLLTYIPSEGSPEHAGRIEFQGNAVGKGSAKLYTFASWRFAVATYLLGFDTRDKRKIQRETKELLADEESYKTTLGEMEKVFTLASRKLPGWQQLVNSPTTFPAKTFRENSVLGTAAGLTALAYALKAAKDAGEAPGEAIDRMSKVNWAKAPVNGKQPFFDYTIIVGGKVLSSRTNFEPAGYDLARVAVGEDPETVMRERLEEFVKQVEESKQALDEALVETLETSAT